MVLFETSPFWVAILSCLILREKVKLLEIIGIFVCFGGVIMLGIGKQKRIDEVDAVEIDLDDTEDDGGENESYK